MRDGCMAKIRTKCLKCLETMSWRASVALVVSRVTMGLRVIICPTGVVCGSSPSAVTCAANVSMRHPVIMRGILTRYAKSFAVKIPLRPSSSSTTNTQSVLLAAQSWLASATVIFSGTVSAGLGLSAATVPFATAGFPPRFPRLCWWVVEIVRFRASSDSIFFRIAC